MQRDPVALKGLAQQRLGLLGMSPFPQDARKVLAGVRNVWQEGFGIVCRQKTHGDELLADEGFGVTQETLIQEVPRQVMAEGRHKGQALAGVTLGKRTPSPSPNVISRPGSYQLQR